MANYDDNKNPSYVYVDPAEEKRIVLEYLCHTFYGRDPKIDAAIDAHVEEITGFPGKRFIPLHGSKRPTPPFFEGPPGQAKTHAIFSASTRFCEITGLNYVKNPDNDYTLDPDKDFYLCMVNLSGKTNLSDFGGMPVRSKVGGTGYSPVDDMGAKLETLAGLANTAQTAGRNYCEGNNRVREYVLTGEGAERVAEVAMAQVADKVKAQGLGVSAIKSDAEFPADRVAFKVTKDGNKVTLAVSEPSTLVKDEVSVVEMLPNRRFQMAKEAKFSLYLFDDLPNASPVVRNAIMEVVQFGEYSGLINIKNAGLVATGNEGGAKDNTNVQGAWSEAELTRFKKFNVEITPKLWAEFITDEYSRVSPVGDCYMAGFIARFGDQPGLFQTTAEQRRERGAPKTNARALENGLKELLPLAEFCRENEISLTDPRIQARIKEMLGATCSVKVATEFGAYLYAMASEAIPMAEQVIKTGNIDQAKFDEKSEAGIGAPFKSTTSKDFGYRFANALADEAFMAMRDNKNLADDKRSDANAKVAHHLALGLAQMETEPAMTAYALTRLVSRLRAMGETSETALSQDMTTALTAGFKKSLEQGAWSDPDIAKQEFISLVSGYHGKVLQAAAPKP